MLRCARLAWTCIPSHTLAECDTNKEFMVKDCPASCGVCTALEEADKEEL